MDSPVFPLPAGSAEYQLALAMADFTLADIADDERIATPLRMRAARNLLAAGWTMLSANLLLLGMSPTKVNTLSWDQLAELNPDAIAIIRWYFDSLSPAGRTTISAVLRAQRDARR